MTNLNRKLAKSFLPQSAVLELTYRCNQKCVFCSNPWCASEPNFDQFPELTKDEWFDVITLLVKKGVKTLTFTGGEPLLKKGFDEILSHAVNIGNNTPEILVISNGKKMSNRVLDLLADDDVNLMMSLPGIRTYEYHTGGEDPKKILKWFSEAQSRGINSTAGITVTKKNLYELEETISLALLSGAENILLNRFLPGGRGLSHIEELSLSISEIQKMLEITEKVLDQSNRLGAIGTELPRCIVDPSQYNRLQVSTKCAAGVGFFVIGPSGYIRVCNHSETRLNHITEVDELKSNQYWRMFTQKEYLPDNCLSCQYMLECDGGCREAANILSNTLKAEDPILSEK